MSNKLQEAQEKADVLTKQLEKYKMGETDWQNQFLINIGLQPGSTYHLLKRVNSDRASFLQCVDLRFDPLKANRSLVCIDSKGELVNTPSTDQGDSNEAFSHYFGTSTNNPIVRTGSPQYFEITCKVDLNKSLGERDILLELGFSGKDDRDVGQYLPARKNCYSVCLAFDSKRQRISMKTNCDKKEEYEDVSTISNSEGSQETVEFGILIDVAKNRLVFYKYNSPAFMVTYDKVNLSEFWPMFGLSSRVTANVSMKLVVGPDINMTPAKKAQIKTTLSTDAAGILSSRKSVTSY